MTLRAFCQCHHARSAHAGGACVLCPCKAFDIHYPSPRGRTELTWYEAEILRVVNERVRPYMKEDV